jgi:MOSC domain-containing protein YiiM
MQGGNNRTDNPRQKDGQTTMGTIISLNISREKGVNKEPVESIELRVDHGMVGDAHAGDWHRQVSLLAEESIDFMRSKGLELEPGAFAENITTEGLELAKLPLGTRLGNGQVVLEVTQIGKKCHHGCAIFQQVGDCIMPREGIFTKVIVPGTLRRGDSLDILP